MEHQRVRETFFIALFLGAVILSFFIFKPYLITLAVTSTIAVIVQPIYRFLLKSFKGREGIAAFVTAAATVLVVLAPLTFVTLQIIRESTQLYGNVSDGDSTLSFQFLRDIEAMIRSYIPGVSIPPLEQYVGQAVRWIAASVGPLLAGTATTVIHILLGVVALFYILRDGKRIMAAIIRLSPLKDKDDHQILSRLETAINSIVRGSLLIAILQGISSSVGLSIFGVPSAILWGSIATIAALIPSLGTSVVLGPAIIYLFFTGHTLPAVGLLIWALLAVGLIDNFLGPMLVGKGARIHPMLILFAVLGGLALFGPAGFLLGPLVISLLFALLDIYSQGILHGGTVKPNVPSAL